MPPPPIHTTQCAPMAIFFDWPFSEMGRGGFDIGNMPEVSSHFPVCVEASIGRGPLHLRMNPPRGRELFLQVAALTSCNAWGEGGGERERLPFFCPARKMPFCLFAEGKRVVRLAFSSSHLTVQARVRHSKPGFSRAQ